LTDPETAALLRARRLGLGERFHPRKDGTTLVSMRVRGIDELANWVLGFGPHVKVLRPAALRERVARDLRAASELYGAT
jgi:predicted DNA-binding transcriptional regulator YafY